MSNRSQSWTSFVREEGRGFLDWVHENRILSSNFDVLVSALWCLLNRFVKTKKDALDLWMTVPGVPARCNDQRTYLMPMAPVAYAWLHLPDRYVRTWLALEQLVSTATIPMGVNGVTALDVGTGPGPSAFAVNDFYAAMVAYSDLTGNSKWRQPASVFCMEIDDRTNSVRHFLTELVVERSPKRADSLSPISSTMGRFDTFFPTADRAKRFERLRDQEDYYFDDVVGEWVSETTYTIDEANYIAQSSFRFRLIVFSNFLTTVGTVKQLTPNLFDLFKDANRGTGLLVIGGKCGEYPEIYDFVDDMAKRSGFAKVLEGKPVSFSQSEVARKVVHEARRIYGHLATLVPDEIVDELVTETLNDEDKSALLKLRMEMSGGRFLVPSSQVRAYRKY